ncbi:TIGR01777 family oxidoreductase [Flavobacterium rhizosphaerae]|uniref:TIGR01777 family oxidoreductase n=1 Tax=Flavobacterium rhizosphaerae TaxID=3163298 RepID=A0ABW8YY77_9FLAO
MKKLIIAAGTGFLGNTLIKHFKNETKQIIVLTRGKNQAKDNIRYVHWDAKSITGWEHYLEGADVLINLTGKSVNCRYNDKNKAEILYSRIDSTKILAKAIQQCKHPPKHWINASTATIYRHSEDRQMDEATGETGNDFSMTVANKWESAFFGTPAPSVIKTAIRTSIVLGKDGGALPIMLKIAKCGLGGRQGNGQQFVSWVHQEDFARAVEFIINNKIANAVNVTAPNPVHNYKFMKILRKKLGVPFGLSQPKWMLKIGAKIIGTETELILKSRNVVPARLSGQGFRFKFDTAEKALGNLLQ